jgi:hypothetical protein
MTYGKTVLRSFAAALLSAAFLGGAAANAAVLTNGTGDGQVSINLNDNGYFGDGSYNPVGAAGASDAIYASTLYMGIAGGGVADLGSVAATFVSGDARQRTSTFKVGSVQFTLIQTLSDLISNGVQTGTMLTQSYSFTNTGNQALGLNFSRYLDGDLNFGPGGGGNDGGGKLIAGGQTILFETDAATGKNDLSTFIGIYNEGGTALGYDIDHYGALRPRVGTGQPYQNAIKGDGNADGFIDAGAGYDVALAIGNGFSVGAGQQGIFTTRTIFGSGTPNSVQVPGVPEPGSWAMMVGGFGLAGAAMRRRRTALATA